jgi:hypothetical protein
MYNVNLNHIDTIIKNIRNSLYIEYETSILVEYIEKYPLLMKNYTKKIFDEYIEYFINLYKLYYKSLFTPKRISSEEKIRKLFKFVFSDKNNKFNESNIREIAYFVSGCEMIKYYIDSEGTFDLKQTKALMNSITEISNHEIRVIIIDLLDNFDVFEVDESLIEHAACIPINKYVYRSIEKNIKISSQCYYNIIKYSNDLELCKLALEYNNTLLDSNCLNYACQSRNKEIILFVFNNKIMPDNKLFESIFFKINNSDVYIISENNKLTRTIHTNQYCTEYDIIKILDKYGYIFTYDDFFICLENRILIENFNFDFSNDQLIQKFFDICIQKSFYPYFINKKKYPIPTIDCLHKECEKKNNMKVIKQLAKSLNLCNKFILSVENNNTISKKPKFV